MNDNTNVSQYLEATMITSLRILAQWCLAVLSHAREMQGGSKPENITAQLNKLGGTHLLYLQMHI